MLFGVRLANQMYPPWRDSYIEYERLKKLLKESVIENRNYSGRRSQRNEQDAWTEKDESNFVAVLDAELEKVYSFQSHKYNSIMDKLLRLEEKTDDEEAIKSLDFNKFQQVLEESLSEAQELDNFCRVNFTGFIKIVKKHDKLASPPLSVRKVAATSQTQGIAIQFGGILSFVVQDFFSLQYFENEFVNGVKIIGQLIQIV